MQAWPGSTRVLSATRKTVCRASSAVLALFGCLLLGCLLRECLFSKMHPTAQEFLRDNPSRVKTFQKDMRHAETRDKTTTAKSGIGAGERRGGP